MEFRFFKRILVYQTPNLIFGADLTATSRLSFSVRYGMLSMVKVYQFPYFSPPYIHHHITLPKPACELPSWSSHHEIYRGRKDIAFLKRHEVGCSWPVPKKRRTCFTRLYSFLDIAGIISKLLYLYLRHTGMFGQSIAASLIAPRKV